MAHMRSSPPGTSRPLRFVHTADLHLGSRVTNLSGLDQSASMDLLNSTYRAWKEIIDLCIRESVDFLLVAGDVHDSADQNIRAQLQFVEGLKRLGEKGIAVYIVRGNHDPDNAWSNSITMPDNAHIFSSKGPELIIHRDREGRPLAAIVGMSFATAHVRDNLAERFPDRDNEWPYTIGLLHCNVGGAQGHEPYAPCSIEDLRRCGYDYWALGHIHQPTVLEVGPPYIAYSGNPQGRDMGETGERGCLLVTVDSDSAEVQSIGTAQHRWEEIELDVSGSEDWGDLEEYVRAELSAITEAAGTPIIGRLVLTGSTMLHRELTFKDRAATIQERLLEDPLDGRYLFYPERIACRTMPVIDRDAVLARDDILGEVCRQSDRALSGESVRDRLAEGMNDLFVRSTARSYLDEPDDDEIDAIIREAEALLLSHLSKEGAD